MREVERKRLVKLIEEAKVQRTKDYFKNEKTEVLNIPIEEYSADHLLENGIIVPPCKVGTPLYMIVEKRAKVTKEYFTLIKKTKLTFGNMERVIEGFGKTVFLSEAEAKYALKNRRSVSLVDGHIEE